MPEIGRDSVEELAEDAREALNEQVTRERQTLTRPVPIVGANGEVREPLPVVVKNADYSHLKSLAKAAARALEPVLIVAALAGMDYYQHSDAYLKLAPATIIILLPVFAYIRNFLKNRFKLVAPEEAARESQNQ